VLANLSAGCLFEGNRFVKKALYFSILSLLVATLTSSSFAQSLIGLSARDAAVHSDGGSALSGPSSGSTLEIIGEFLSLQGRSNATAASLSVVSEGTNANTGLTHVRLGQQVNGLSVYGTYVKATLNSDGELIHLIELLADPSSRVTTTSIDADDALRAARCKKRI
jgi:Zn-dependent metalloprotease